MKFALPFALLLSATVANAAECRLALLLGLDISSSVDATEDALQRGGTVAALRSPEVQAAFFISPQPVALAVFEWSGRYNQEVVLDWVIIDSPASIERAARVIANSTRSYAEFPTAIGEALDFASEMLARGPQCTGQTIDLAGDGENNEGIGTAAIFAKPGFDQITVNGLVVANAADFQTEARLVAHYRDRVLHGPGAFFIIADGYADYTRAMRLKLLRELTPPAIGNLPLMRSAG